MGCLYWCVLAYLFFSGHPWAAIILAIIGWDKGSKKNSP